MRLRESLIGLPLCCLAINLDQSTLGLGVGVVGGINLATGFNVMLRSHEVEGHHCSQGGDVANAVQVIQVTFNIQGRPPYVIVLYQRVVN